MLPASSLSNATAASADDSGPPAMVAARHAIETITRIADAQAGQSESTDVVSFGFKFGSDNLTVRVEMRQGEVRTQFSTDSADLRLAIATEWPGLSEGSTGRNYHFSSPQFTHADGLGSDTGSGPGGDRQPSSARDPGPNHPSGARSAAADRELEPDTRAAAIPATARHLHTVA
jgi:hypothetical protein